MRWGLAIVLVSLSLYASTADAQRRSRPEPPAETPSTPTPQEQAPATSPEQARPLFLEGQRLYTAGEYEQAIVKWREAYALHPAPALLYNLAQAYGRLGDFQNELDSLRAYMAAVPENDPNAEPARARVTALETRLQRTGLSFTGLASDAELEVDGVVVPNPADGELVSREPGPHDVAVRRRGHRPFEARIEVVQGRTSSVEVVQPALDEVRAPIVGYALLAVGGAALGTALATGLVAFQRSPDAFAGTPEGDRAHRLALASDVTAGIGLAAAATGLVFVILRDRPESDGYDDTALRIVPVASADRCGLLLDGRF